MLRKILTAAATLLIVAVIVVLPPGSAHAVFQAGWQLIQRNDKVTVHRPEFKQFRSIFLWIVELRIKLLLTHKRLLNIFTGMWRVRHNQLANDIGYWHMGQPAHNYRLRFGELPSATLNSV